MDAFTSSELAAYVDARMTGHDQVSKQPSNAKGARRQAAAGYLVAITSFLMRGWGYERLAPIITDYPGMNAAGIYDMLLLNYGDASEAGPYLNEANPGGPTQPDTSGTGKERELVIAIGAGGVPTGITTINFASIIARPGASGWRIKMRFKPNYGFSGTIAKFSVSRVTTGDSTSRQYMSGEGTSITYHNYPTQAYAWEISSATIGAWNERIMLVNVLPEKFPNLQFDAAFECFNHLFSLGLPVAVTGSDVFHPESGGYYALEPNPNTKPDVTLRQPVFDAEVIVYRRAPMLVRYLVTGHIVSGTLPTTFFGRTQNYNAAILSAISAATNLVVTYIGWVTGSDQSNPYDNPALWVDFTDDSITSNQKIGYAWTFGDSGAGLSGGQGTNAARNLYKACGVYQSSLIVTDSSGGDTFPSAANSRTIVILPYSYPYLYNTAPSGGDVQAFFASSSFSLGSTPPANEPLPGGPGTTFLWDFGDGGTSTLRRPSHIFVAPARLRTITLTVTAANGFSVSSSIQYTL